MILTVSCGSDAARTNDRSVMKLVRVKPNKPNAMSAVQAATARDNPTLCSSLTSSFEPRTSAAISHAMTSTYMNPHTHNIVCHTMSMLCACSPSGWSAECKADDRTGESVGAAIVNPFLVQKMEQPSAPRPCGPAPNPFACDRHDPGV